MRYIHTKADKARNVVVIDPRGVKAKWEQDLDWDACMEYFPYLFHSSTVRNASGAGCYWKVGTGSLTMKLC